MYYFRACTDMIRYRPFFIHAVPKYRHPGVSKPNIVRKKAVFQLIRFRESLESYNKLEIACGKILQAG